MVKVRDNKQNLNQEQRESEFLNQMSDKPYGVEERLERLTISMRGDVFDMLDNESRIRKRQKKDNRTMSAIAVEAIRYYFEHKNKS